MIPSKTTFFDKTVEELKQKRSTNNNIAIKKWKKLFFFSQIKTIYINNSFIIVWYIILYKPHRSWKVETIK